MLLRIDADAGAAWVCTRAPLSRAHHLVRGRPPKLTRPAPPPLPFSTTHRHFQWPPSNTWPPTPMGADLSTNVAVTMTRDGAPVTVTIIYQDADIIVWETADPCE